MWKYVKYIRIAIKKEFYYKTNMFGLILTTLFALFIQVKLWEAIYAGNESLNGILYSNMFLYIVIGIILRKFLGCGIDETVSTSFQSGNIAVELLKPQSYFWKTVCMDVGRGSVHLIIVSIIGMLFFVTRNYYIPSKLTVLLVVVSSILGYVIFVTMSYCIGLASVWLGRSVGLTMLKSSMFYLLGGAIIPIDFYPQELAKVVEYLPFKYIYYTPISFLIRDVHRDDITKNLCMQIVWCVFWGILGKLISVNAQKKMVIQGG